MNVCVCVDAHLQLHVHTAGQALPGHVFYGLTRQTIPVARILHRLEEFTLKTDNGRAEGEGKKERQTERERPRDRPREGDGRRETERGRPGGRQKERKQKLTESCKLGQSTIVGCNIYFVKSQIHIPKWKWSSIDLLGLSRPLLCPEKSNNRSYNVPTCEVNT